ncbi:protein phosphatase regulator PIG1 KNAG_0F02980 [Huiozyma naganishii CBS 8797]|uniref:CBM21 domain-containing protein n=1 Tax=Huiozyma naganishii (strain ATCC MYA-139 / BCRC 22969 / CBS 8797 / KCTC 17520 / NBRC 10181 / NCYC 3082 / Yp74L-3) TaxID=1071383 RepID=J7R7Z0_HUIN7|nr:hypothetical protein KNAG_0F02980 [Kazachstania naganishii CBS 8797]CCK70960.1 hypothetical protein KNAG_0F02980 [Kazachstania naganishii CBS 8797]
MRGSLKPSLKGSSRRSSLSSTGSTDSSSSSSKFVRFASELTTVKSFHSTDKPITISAENSPDLSFVNDTTPLTGGGGGGYEGDVWFNDLESFPLFVRGNSFQLDYDSDSDNDNDSYSYGSGSASRSIRKVTSPVPCEDDTVFDVVEWDFVKSNLEPPTAEQTRGENDIFSYMNGQNIKLHSLRPLDGGKTKLEGLIYVNNLNFEKFIEIKFTFNDWLDIHYVTATYNRSITGRLDEFKFVVNLDAMRYFLKFKKLLYCKDGESLCPLSLKLCCRYDVNYETYYDNNNYQNYEFNFLVRTVNELYLSTHSQQRINSSISKRETPESTTSKTNNNNTNCIRKSSFYSDFLVSTTLSHKLPFDDTLRDGDGRIPRPSVSRSFSDDTDYYNTSPLKHLYHNDTTLIKPTSLNSVLLSLDTGTSMETAVDANNNRSEREAEKFMERMPDGAGLDDPPIYTTPSLCSSLSSSLSDLSPLQDFNESLMDGKDDVFYYNDNDNETLLLDPYDLPGKDEFFDDQKSVATETPLMYSNETEDTAYHENGHKTVTMRTMDNGNYTAGGTPAREVSRSNNSNDTLINTRQLLDDEAESISSSSKSQSSSSSSMDNKEAGGRDGSATTP